MTSASHAEGRQFNPGQVYQYNTHRAAMRHGVFSAEVGFFSVELGFCSAELAARVFFLPKWFFSAEFGFSSVENGFSGGLGFISTLLVFLLPKSAAEFAVRMMHVLCGLRNGDCRMAPL